MELKWLEDFIALSENGSFSKAANARYVTQPAFSRRIRSLENWLGIVLVNRDALPTSLTDAGTEFVEEAQRLINDITEVRNRLQQRKNPHSLIFLAQHSTAVSFFPAWIQTLSPLVADAVVKLVPGNIHNLNEAFLAGSGDFLLTFASQALDSPQMKKKSQSIQVGRDRLIPVSAPDEHGDPLHRFNNGVPCRLLAFPEETYLGGLIKKSAISSIPSHYQYDVVCENEMAEGLKAMATQGFGATWLPSSLVKQELEEKRLVELDAALPRIDLRILLYRNRHSVKAEVERFWIYLNELYGKE
ncbi:LysR family transcriptional regulator [Enterovibrio makurazakiensis]|uniref:LysR family transcriptional regulator n=1 Tax=Enterovibrio gelatinilyticus TaxID=2899819 RepID=A0ABT5QZK9_9GAMM|nr:LysR family transcriptional regulator [Enterovibrio sp. ZSDZ42]MDD1793350.1 LysR family transcriptional regulator [Enterovibrio sp. ZSDZ42]